MAFWQVALILLAVVWALQSAATWMQMRHFREVMGQIQSQWSDGRVGAGNARGRLGKGVVAVLVVDPGSVVRRLLLMEGRSVFAKFKPLDGFQGWPLERLRSPDTLAALGAGRRQAIERAIEQIDRVAQREAAAGAALVGAPA